MGRRGAPARGSKIRALHPVRVACCCWRMGVFSRSKSPRVPAPPTSSRLSTLGRRGHASRHPQPSPRSFCWPSPFAVKSPVVAAAHLAAGRPHRGTDGRFGDPGGGAAEDGHVRAASESGCGSCPTAPSGGPRPRRPRGDGHHLRVAGLSGPTDLKSIDRLLIGRPHGFCVARLRDAHPADSTPP